ncbi:hypothetical protein Enr13x_78090 [Stieleria neptunia]|uniref:Tetratricopeptide repeat protein n=2 Tax=Stieleria neptunia TaxID=2527979 RepID=A0A518I4B5_9BACT|nr:hypothetical protein Enr13x_78090 [Stieleria neptunia]
MTVHCVRSLARCAFLVACFTSLGGCRMGAPIHVWSPPTLRSTVGHSVMVPKIVGPQELATPIHEKLLLAAPADAGRSTRLVSAESINASTPGFDQGVSLVSYNADDESDLALAKKAQQGHIDFILRGEILPDRRPRSITEAGNRLTVSWRLMPVSADVQAPTEGRPLGKPVVVELESALERYPDLALAADKDVALQSALVRETLPLITPAVVRERVQLEIPYLLPGTQAIRRGNALAVAGRWGQAEAIWQEVYQRYPFSSVAVHNLAIAAVAKQEFGLARSLASRAVRMKPTKLHQQTLVWVERAQRAYHEAFQLPDPPEGWSVTRTR